MGGQQEHVVKGQPDGRELVRLVRKSVISHGTFTGSGSGDASILVKPVRGRYRLGLPSGQGGQLRDEQGRVHRAEPGGQVIAGAGVEAPDRVLLCRPG